MAVTAVADAVSAEPAKANPEAAEYFTARRAGFSGSLQPYNSLIEKIKAAAAGKSYAATESVFDYRAEAVGLINKTPQGYRQAAANEADLLASRHPGISGSVGSPRCRCADLQHPDRGVGRTPDSRRR